MKHLLSILLTAALCATASAQTIRTLGFNTTNGQVVANTGTNVLTFTNDVNFGDGDLTVSGQVIFGSGVSLSFDDGEYSGPLYMEGGTIQFSGATNASATRANLGFSTNLNTLWTGTNASNARSAVGLGATWLTNTNVTNFRSAIGLGATNAVSFSTVQATNVESVNALVGLGGISFEDDGQNVTRTNLGLGSGITTNRTFVSYNGTNYTTNSVTISNGIITGWTQ